MVPLLFVAVFLTSFLLPPDGETVNFFYDKKGLLTADSDIRNNGRHEMEGLTWKSITVGVCGNENNRRSHA